MSDNYVPSAIWYARDIPMNKVKFLLLGLYSLAEETKLIMENFSKMQHAMVEVYRSFLRTFQIPLISLGP